MALIKCDECGKKISDKSKKCISCGYPIKKIDNKRKNIFENFNLKQGSIVFIVLFLILAFSTIKMSFLSNYNLSYSIIDIIKFKVLNMHFLIIGVYILTFVSLLLTFINNKLSKIFYTLNYIFFLCIFGLSFISNYRVSYSFYIIFALNICLYLFQNKFYFEEKKQNRVFSLTNVLKYLSVLIYIIVILLNFIKVQPQSNAVNPNLNQIEVLSEYINIRKKPNTSSETLGKVHYKEIYTILDEISTDSITWYKIETSNNIKGYIANPSNSNYISIINEEFNIPKYKLAFKVNPTFVLEVNNVEVVIGYRLLNDDTWNVDANKIINLPIKDSLKNLIKLSEENGWLNDKKVAIYTYDKNSKDLKDAKFYYISSILKEIDETIDVSYNNILGNDVINNKEEQDSKNQKPNKTTPEKNNNNNNNNNKTNTDEVKKEEIIPNEPVVAPEPMPEPESNDVTLAKNKFKDWLTGGMFKCSGYICYASFDREGNRMTVTFDLDSNTFTATSNGTLTSTINYKSMIVNTHYKDLNIKHTYNYNTNKFTSCSPEYFCDNSEQAFMLDIKEMMNSLFSNANIKKSDLY